MGGTLAFELYDESNVDTVTTVEDSENMDERPGHESGDTGATRLRELQPHVDTDLNLNTARHSNGKVYYLERNEQRESNEVSVVIVQIQIWRGDSSVTIYLSNLCSESFLDNRRC